MRRVVYHGIRDVRVDVCEPRPEPNEGVVRVECCGICGSDQHEITMIGTNSIDAERALEWIVSDELEPEKIVTSCDVKILVEP